MEQVVAVDVGGTKLAVGLVGRNGSIATAVREPTPDTDAEALYGLIESMIERVVEEALAPPVAIGVGCSGPAREQHRLMSPLNIPAWRDFPLRERLTASFGLDAFVDNDAKALALGEGWRGAAAGLRNYLAMVVSTGVGGGIVLNGRLLDGADGNAGHIGHVFVEPDGHPDAGGVRGLLEGSASGTAIAAMLGVPAAEAPTEHRRRVGTWVGRAAASVANLLDLQLVVVAGSVALGYGDDFFDSAQATIDELCRIQHSRGTRIVPAGLGADGPLVGAGAVGWSGLGVDVLAEGAGQAADEA